MTLTFAWPEAFWLLLLLPILVGIKVAGDARARRAAARISSPRLLPSLLLRPARWRGWVVLGFELFALACFFAALARPRYGNVEEEAGGSGRSILIALDTSKSMLANDLEPSRLERARLTIIDLINRLRGERVGLMPFAGTAFLYAPLTNDSDALLDSMELMDSEIIPRGGSNLARAIELAVSTYEETDVAGQQALIILSDGEELEGTALEAARKARERNIVIVTIGVGTERGGLIPDPEAPGKYHRDSAGRVVNTKLQREVLERLAQITGGLYLPLGPAVANDAGISLILEKLQRTSMKGKTTQRPVERYRWPLTAGLLSLLAGFLTGIVSRHRKPALASVSPGNLAAVRALPLVPVLLALALNPAGFPAARAEPAAKETGMEKGKEPEKEVILLGDPWRQYATGDYVSAKGNFETALEEAADRDRPAIQFGLGAAAYRTRDWDKAVDAFGGALLARDVATREKAHYNLANALYQRARSLAEAARPEDVDVAFLDQLIRQLENSLEHYQQALALQPDDPEARKNHDITDQLIEELRQRREQQEQDGPGSKGKGKSPSQKGRKNRKGENPGENQGDSESGENPGDKGEGGDQPKEGKGKRDRDDEKGEDRGETEEERKAREDSNRDRQGDVGTRGEAERPGEGEKGKQQEKGGTGPNGKEPKDKEKGKGQADGDNEEADKKVNPKTGFSRAEARRAMEQFSDEDFNVRRSIDPVPEFQPAKDW